MKNKKSVRTFTIKSILGTFNGRSHFKWFKWFKLFKWFKNIPSFQMQSTDFVIASWDKISLSPCFLAKSSNIDVQCLRYITKFHDSPMMENPPILPSFKSSTVWSWLTEYAFEIKSCESSPSSWILFWIIPWSCSLISDLFSDLLSDLSFPKIVFINAVARTLQ